MNRRPLAPAPTSVQNVAQATLRSHSRAAHGGSGTYTEMRAQIRKEREQQRHVGAGPNHATTHAGRDVDQHARKSSSASANTSIQLSTSVSDQKITQYSSDPTTDDQTAERKSYLRVMAPSSFAMSSDNISNMSNASSQISSSSSQGVVKKRSQTLSTQPQQQPQQPQQPQLLAQTQPHVQSHQPHSQMHQLQNQLQNQLQLQHQHQQPLRHDTRYTFQEDLLPRVSSPLLEEEQQIGIDALQDAFQAKYYELAAKCKGWEKYSAKLKAHLGALEAENRLIKEQNSQLEDENAELRAVVLQEAKTRTKLEGRMNTLEDCLSQRSLSGGNLNAQYRAVDVVDYDHLSVPSAPSSAERNAEAAPAPRHTPYCSSNLQFEDRSELRPSASSHPNAFSMVQTVTATQHLEPELGAQIAPSSRDFSLEGARSSMDTTRSIAGSQSPMPEHISGAGAFDGPARVAAEGRSSRLGTRSDVPEKRPAHQRSGTVGALGMVVPRAGTVLGDYRGTHALTSQALAHQDAAESIARPASAQRFHGTYLESNIATTAASIVASTGVTKAALQSKRRSTVSGDRASSLSLAQIVKGALTASGVVARSSSTTLSRQASPNDKPQSSSDYLQECVEKRREAMRSSFNAQQKTMTPIGSQTVPSRPASRAASRLSTQSGARTRSRAGSVHDAIPVAVEDIFCNPKTVKAHSNETSPEFLTEQLAAASLNVHADIAAASQRLMAATEAQPVRLMARKELSNASSPSSLVSASPALEAEEGISFERKLYMRFQQELDGEEFQKFERCIQRYDFLDIPLEGSKGLITRVKRLLLVSDPDLRSKPDKLRVRQQLARDFEKMAKNFSQAQSTQP